MIRRHPWRTALVVGVALLPSAFWFGFIEAWWAYQGRQAWGRPA